MKPQTTLEFTPQQVAASVRTGLAHGNAPSAANSAGSCRALAAIVLVAVAGRVSGAVVQRAGERPERALARQLSLARGAFLLLAGVSLRAAVGIPAIFRPRACIGVASRHAAAAPVRDDADPAGAGGGVWHSQRLWPSGLAGLAVPAWLAVGFSPYGLQGILLAHVFFNMPMATRLLLQALENIPGEQRQIAAQLGMRGWSFFRLVEWPWLRRQIPPVAALIFMLFASFATVLSLGGGPQATTIELAIYQALSYDYDPGARRCWR
jgi:hypothetical protein